MRFKPVSQMSQYFDFLFSAALSDPSSRLSTSPPPPAIAVPLLEMGFSLRQITKALEATGPSQSSSLPVFTILFCLSSVHSVLNSHSERQYNSTATSEQGEGKCKSVNQKF